MSIKVIFLITLIWSILYQFVLIDYPALNNFIYRLGEFTQILCLSYIAAFIFFFVNTHLPRHVQKEKLKGIIKIQLKEFYDVCNNLQYAFYCHSTVPQISTNDIEIENQAKKTAKKLPVIAEKTIVIYTQSFNNWKDALIYSSGILDKQMNNLMEFKEEMDIDTILALNNIKSSAHFLQLQLAQVLDGDSPSPDRKVMFSDIHCEAHLAFFRKNLNKLEEIRP